jgi:lipoprotein-releasing system ATP-binding protein
MKNETAYLIEASNLHKSYNDGRKNTVVLKGVDLRIEKGAFIAVIGQSGAGKSTLLHILGGLDVPTQGEVLFEGESLYSLNEAGLAGVRNRRIGFVFQFYHLLGEFTVLENVMMPAIINKASIDKINGIRAGAVDFLKRGGIRAPDRTVQE